MAAEQPARRICSYHAPNQRYNILMKEQAYRWNAEDYARNSAAQFQWAQELIEKLALRGDERVLDIGCGDGKVSAGIAQRVPHGCVTGVDRSWQMVDLAEKAFPHADWPNLRFAQMDASRLGFGAGFDVAFSNATLHWVLDHRPVLAGVARSLAKLGRLLFQMGGRGNAADIIAVLDAVRARPQWREWFRDFRFPYGFYAPDEYIPWIREAGLRERRVELISKDMQHNGREGLAGWIRTTWLPYLERVPAERREDFMQTIIDEYCARSPADAQGIVHVKMVRLEVEAEK
jgi:trans-aconitate 2-methyltransferase